MMTHVTWDIRDERWLDPAALRDDLNALDAVRGSGECPEADRDALDMEYCRLRRRLATLGPHHLSPDEIGDELDAIDADLEPPTGPAAYLRPGPGQQQHEAELRALAETLRARLRDLAATAEQ
jgi:hypothetical protein